MVPRPDCPADHGRVYERSQRCRVYRFYPGRTSCFRPLS
ncbi:peptidase [Corynebacterium phage CL31]|nr:peptidase [Corynebacterium phage CL31]